MKKAGSAGWGMLMVFIISCILFGGCGDKGIEGDWILYEEVTGDGTVMSQKDLEKEGISEEYSIEGETVHYVLNAPAMGKPVSFDLTLVEKGKNKYDFKLKSIVFASVELSGDTFSYTVGEVADSSKMIFKRK